MATETLSLRISAERKAQLEDILNKIGGTKDNAVSAIISAFESQQIKEELPERSAELDTMQALLKQVNDIYLSSVAISKQAENRIREEFANRLNASETAISELKEKAEKAVLEADEARKEAEEATKKAEELEAKLVEKEKELATINQLLTEKTATNSRLEKDLNEAKEGLSDYPLLSKNNIDLQRKINEKDTQITILNNDLNTKNEQIETLGKNVARQEIEIKELTEKLLNMFNTINEKEEKIKAGYEVKLSEVKAENEARLTEIKAEYEARLTENKASLVEIKAEKNELKAQIKELENDLKNALKNAEKPATKGKKTGDTDSKK